MFQTLILPTIGALLLLGWVGSAVWGLWPRSSADAAPTSTAPAGRSDLARAKAARGYTRGGLAGIVVMVAVAFVAVRVLFVLPGWFQVAWVLAIVAAAFVIWRVVVLWPTAQQEQELQDFVTAHGLTRVRPPWTMIIVGLALLALWWIPPLFLF